MAPTTLTDIDVRAARIAAQGLGAADGIAAALACGPIRTLGGIDAYLALHARAPGLSVEAIHQAVAAGEARVVPAVRGCIYLVARADVGWAMALAERLSAPKAAREHAKAGIAEGELAAVGDAIVASLAGGPATTDAIKKALPAGLVRSLGDAGKKLGLTSTLPPALRALEFQGRIERTLAGGRLDSERYLWRGAQWPLAKVAEPEREAAKVFVRAAGVGTAAAFAEWSGLGVTAARKALAAAAADEVATPDGPAWAWPDRAPAETKAVAFLPFVDNVCALHLGPAYLVDPAHHGLAVQEWGGGMRATTLGRAKYMFYRSVFADDRIVALWEWDPAAEDVVLGFFARPAKALATRVRGAAEVLAGFIRAIGHGRSFSLDSEEALSGRCDQIKALGLA